MEADIYHVFVDALSLCLYATAAFLSSSVLPFSSFLQLVSDQRQLLELLHQLLNFFHQFLMRLERRD